MLKEIIENKIKEIKLLRRYNDADLEKIINEYKPRGFLNALKKKRDYNHTAIIAEIKRYSPSKGRLNMELDVNNIASQYEKNGAACISVLTDHKYFKRRSKRSSGCKEVLDFTYSKKRFYNR